MRKTLTLIIFSIICVVLVSPLYSAHHEKKKSYSAHFGDMDYNGDDYVDWTEFKNYFSHAKKDVFDEADDNGDGIVNHDEWHEFKDSHGYDHSDDHHKD